MYLLFDVGLCVYELEIFFFEKKMERSSPRHPNKGFFWFHPWDFDFCTTGKDVDLLVWIRGCWWNIKEKTWKALEVAPKIKTLQH